MSVAKPTLCRAHLTSRVTPGPLRTRLTIVKSSKGEGFLGAAEDAKNSLAKKAAEAGIAGIEAAHKVAERVDNLAGGSMTSSSDDDEFHPTSQPVGTNETPKQTSAFDSEPSERGKEAASGVKDNTRPAGENMGDRAGEDWDEIKGTGQEKYEKGGSKEGVTKKGVDLARERAAELDDWTGAA